MAEHFFQTFDENSDPSHGAARLALLREEMERRGLEGFCVPRADEHQNEYVPPCAERLQWLTGFSGSAGFAVVLKNKAAIFVDGRYTLQVRDQVDTAVFEPMNSGETTPEAWVEANVRPGWRIGYDPWLQTPGQVARFEKAAQASGASFIGVRASPVDAIWTDRPQPPHGVLSVHPARFAGEPANKKLDAVRATFGQAAALVVSDPHALAWLFNVRGSDVAHTPIALCFAVVPASGAASLFIDRDRVPKAVQDALAGIAKIEPPTALVTALEKLGAAGARVRFDSQTAPARLVQTLENAGGTAEIGNDPITLMKARKNTVELKGAQAAHQRDGAAMVRFLAWFDTEAPKGRLTEIDAVKALENYRRATKKLKEVSFPTISGAGPNGAIVHYRVTEKTNRKIEPGLFLLDSGAQYEDGTTDITRTLSVGKPSPEMRDRFTRVLKGHIAIATARFPKGTNGGQIDGFARKSLWDAGLDFDHGTGHGVGSYLSVHEGPQRISRIGSVALEAGMILSNEPGYYKAGHWGIRIENLVVVQPLKIDGAERDMLGFDTLTLVPLDTRLVETKLLTRDEIAWIDAYHARVRKEIGPLVDGRAKTWLNAATKPLGKA